MKNNEPNFREVLRFIQIIVVATGTTISIGRLGYENNGMKSDKDKGELVLTVGGIYGITEKGILVWDLEKVPDQSLLNVLKEFEHLWSQLVMILPMDIKVSAESLDNLTDNNE